ncbi:hypothetical protein BDV39DRAFT_172039 [Aspergillus sergii]|uniref:Uncharacterized protein n=1 Tax=Aspergillus sergii TaxID=1034303 RepID=A0A5N6XCE5_9EURO|nr:hypothetical protein BDV39DRAFT_172039 [Aspergillus sergii]
MITSFFYRPFQCSTSSYLHIVLLVNLGNWTVFWMGLLYCRQTEDQLWLWFGSMRILHEAICAALRLPLSTKPNL